MTFIISIHKAQDYDAVEQESCVPLSPSRDLGDFPYAHLTTTSIRTQTVQGLLSVMGRRL